MELHSYFGTILTGRKDDTRYIDTTAYEFGYHDTHPSFSLDVNSTTDTALEHTSQWCWAEHRYIMESFNLSPFAFKGDSGNVVINGDAEPVGIVVSRAMALSAEPEPGDSLRH